MVSKSILMLICLAISTTNGAIDCAGQVELFYEPVNATHRPNGNWTIIDNATDYFMDVTIIGNSSYCYSGDCYSFYQYDYDWAQAGGDFTAFIESPVGAINTANYHHINIVYAVMAISANPNGNTPIDANVTCASMYSVDDGLNWTPIFESYPVDISGDQKQHQIVRAALGEDADDATYLSIELSQYNQVTAMSFDYCFFDEIRICGTPITSPPSSAPTAPSASPTAQSAV
eukprot:UN00842